MNVVEELFCEIIMKIKGSLKFGVHNEKNEIVELDFSRPWKRIAMMPALGEYLKEELPKDLESQEANKFFD